MAIMEVVYLSSEKESTFVALSLRYRVYNLYQLIWRNTFMEQYWILCAGQDLYLFRIAAVARSWKL
jgi:hypothetical protein